MIAVIIWPKIALPGFCVAVVVVVVVGRVCPKILGSFSKPPELPCLGLPELRKEKINIL